MIIDDIIAIPPNWEDGVKVGREWKTGIQTSVVGLEVRSALYTYPRKSLRFRIDGLTSAQSNRLRRVLYKNTSNVIGIPFWNDRTSLTAQANSGQATLSVGSTANRNFEAGAPCIVWRAWNNYEYAEILSFTATSITLNTNLVSTWASGSFVYPVLQGRFDPRQQLGGLTSAITQLNVDIKEAFDADVTKVYIGEDPFITFLNRPVFTLEPNWKESVDQTLGIPYQLWKYLGKEVADTSYNEGLIGTKALFTFYTREDLYEFIKFFDYVRGRWGRFYCPTWMKDVVVTSPISSADTTLTVAAIDWSNYWDIGYDIGPAGSNLFLWGPDGTKVARQITDEPTSTSLQLGSAVGFDVSADGLDYLMACFLPLSRFATDSIEIEHVSEEIAEVSITITTIAGVSSYSSSSSSSSRSSSSSSSSFSSSSSSLSSSSSSSSSFSLSSSSSSFSLSSSSSSRSSSSSSSSFSLSSSSSSSYSTESVSSSSSSFSSSSSSSSSLSFSSSSSSLSLSSSSSSSLSLSSSSSSSLSLSSSSSSSSSSLSSSSSSSAGALADCNFSAVTSHASFTLSNNDVDALKGGASAWYSAVGDPSVGSGKIYFEFLYLNSADQNVILGVGNQNFVSTTYPGSNHNGWGFRGATGQKYHAAIPVSYGAAFTTGDVIGVALDLTDLATNQGKIWFAKNNVWQASGDPEAGTNAAYDDVDGTVLYAVAGAYAANNKVRLLLHSSDWNYAPPSGYSGMSCTDVYSSSSSSSSSSRSSSSSSSSFSSSSSSSSSSSFSSSSSSSSLSSSSSSSSSSSFSSSSSSSSSLSSSSSSSSAGASYSEVSPSAGLKKEPDTAPYTGTTLVELSTVIDDNLLNAASANYWNTHYAYGLDLGSSQDVDRLVVWGVHSVGAGSDHWYSAAYDSVKVLKSDDNATWTLIDTYDGPPLTEYTSAVTEFYLDFATTHTARYFKVVNIDGFLSVGTGGLSLKITEMRAFVAV